MDSLLRYRIDISRIDQINAQIEAYQKMLSWYEGWKDRNEPYEYIEERIEDLNGQLAEYLIARELATESVRTDGLKDGESYKDGKQEKK